MAVADTARLIASLELQDKFSATAAKYERAIGGMDRKTSTLNRIGSEASRGAQTAAKNIATAGVFAAGAITSQVVLGVKSLEELATVTNQTEAAIKSTGGVANVSAEQVRALSESLEDLSTVDDKVIQAGANLLLTFKNVRNEVGEGNDVFNQAVDAANNLALAGFGDMNSAAKQLGKALNDPIKGLASLNKAGVTFSQQQKDRIKRLVEEGDILRAQKIILREIETQVGQSGEAFAKGPGADMRDFGDAVEEGQQALATGFLPVIARVSKEVKEVLGNQRVQAQIREFGEGAAGSVDDLIDVASRLPWAAIGDAFRLMGTGTKAALDFFTGLPPWVQTAVLTGWGLNKLTGGALGNIFSELGKGLIKGVLNMNAAVVNVNGKVVNGPGGGTPTGGGGGRGGGFGRGFAGGLALTGGVVLAGTAAAMTVDFVGNGRKQLEGIGKSLDNLDRQTVPELYESLDKVEAATKAANDGIVASVISTKTGLNQRLEQEGNDLRARVHELNMSEGNRADRFVAQQRAAENAVHKLNASEGTRAATAHARLQGIRDAQSSANATLGQIRDKKSTVNVTVNTSTNVSLAASEVALRVQQLTTTVHGPRIE